MADNAVKTVSPPIFSSLDDLSQGSAVNAQRYKNLVDVFKTKYGIEPHFVVRAPGRVNLIGEHVDYSGYAVLPMAIEQDVAMACRVQALDAPINISNTNPKYHDYQADSKLAITESKKEWSDYVLCGITGVKKYCKLDAITGMDILVDGNIPPASGLSSSSALVCGSAMVAAYANKVDLPSKTFFAEMCAKSEHFIGTEGGGMDQAISFLGEPGKALMIEFQPVRTTEVKLPQGCVIVIANTLVPAEKATAASCFNVRVAECRLASLIMAKQIKLEKWEDATRLIFFQRDSGCKLSETAEKMVHTQLHPHCYDYPEMCTILDKPKSYIQSKFLNSMIHEITEFQLRCRSEHVFNEASRVYKFKDIANTENGMEAAAKLGQLMDESHTSCRDLYECSCSELDEIVSIAKSAGALGSRLTGAGWGGCVVTLVKEDNCQELMDRLREKYYKKYNVGLDNLDASLFVTKPGAGAAICVLNT